MLRRIYLSFLMVAVAVPAMAQVSAIRADFVRERTEARGSPVQVESGHHFITDVGDYVMQKVSNGERTGEVWLPSLNQRITLNHDLQLAVTGPIDGKWPLPAFRSNQPQPTSPPIPTPSNQQPHQGTQTTTYPLDDLGSRLFGLLWATGVRQNIGDTTIETWTWTDQNSKRSLILAQTITSPRGVDSIRITNVQRVTIPVTLLTIPQSYIRQAASP